MGRNLKEDRESVVVCTQSRFDNVRLTQWEKTLEMTWEKMSDRNIFKGVIYTWILEEGEEECTKV